MELARSVADSRVTVLSDGVNRGLIYRLNQIAEHADGSFVARLDADDLMHPERLRKQVTYLESHSDKQLVGTTTYTFDDSGAVVGERGKSLFEPTPRGVLEKGLFVHPTVTARREWTQSHLYDPGYFRAEDLELWCRLSLSDAGFLDEPLYYYREASPINLAAYTASCRTTRKILLRYGPAVLGVRATWIIYLQRWLKEWVYRLSGVFGYQQYLVRRRTRRLGEQERLAAMLTLSAIRATPVAGLDTR